ncbi:DgaE family pyridoxal phosphate-dependent ammonia lyase [Limnobaculum zhutongyuii]|uniref:DgaE family pyridoxal phosphate-dependent ammonia lyase n=1 Tax=Limnobaculum zhutongyuii TaxID=2498113 RepID=A0A411WLA2_9GAMM|nr:DgaE family pyridoxal phosphate-dependent ammonia lyase [Limnobaculum zhutongyuii]QBH96936.1 DgaE family pyridoxal phosphate-dependent ammonia lyase [Limnobaculum zhutongyuii]TQS87514.1 DgaE family pyridoxal phosphate-dependent ammonia lyase [Limnobaculum zhutongyuii]
MWMNIYQRLGLKSVINASGKMTILGVSSVATEVMQATAEAAALFVEIDELVDRVGQLISQHTGAEDSYVTSCASAGIAIAVAAAVTRGEPDLVARLPDSQGLANQIVMLRGHNIDYGAPITTAIRLGGGKVIEVGQSNLSYRWQLEKAISSETAALLYVKSHHCVQKGMVALKDFVEVAQRHHIPLIVDAAAEEDLRAYVAAGASMVIYSGAKALDAPTSGFITGQNQWISYCKAQHNGIARAMKIGKENMVGLVMAMERYQAHQPDWTQQLPELKEIAQKISTIAGFQADIEQDEAGRAIYRIRVKVDPSQLGLNAVEVEELLRTGEIAIYTRHYFLHQGVFSFDPRALKKGDFALIVDRLQEISRLSGAKHAAN